jgi:hypothetical protein
MPIDGVVVVVLWGCPYLPFISKGAEVTWKVSESVTIIALLEFYLYSFLITRYDLIRVGLYL